MMRTADGDVVVTGAGMVRQRLDDLERCAYVAQRLQAAGFVHVCTSMRSEAAYYALPGCIGLIRVAAHGSRKPRCGGRPVVAKITLSENVKHHSHEALENHMALYVGRYLLAHADDEEVA